MVKAPPIMTKVTNPAPGPSHLSKLKWPPSLWQPSSLTGRPKSLILKHLKPSLKKPQFEYISKRSPLTKYRPPCVVNRTLPFHILPDWERSSIIHQSISPSQICASSSPNTFLAIVIIIQCTGHKRYQSNTQSMLHSFLYAFFLYSKLRVVLPLTSGWEKLLIKFTKTSALSKACISHFHRHEGHIHSAQSESLLLLLPHRTNTTTYIQII